MPLDIDLNFAVSESATQNNETTNAALNRDRVNEDRVAALNQPPHVLNQPTCFDEDRVEAEDYLNQTPSFPWLDEAEVLISETSRKSRRFLTDEDRKVIWQLLERSIDNGFLEKGTIEERRGQREMALPLRCSSATAVIPNFKSCIPSKSPFFPISVSFRNPNSNYNSRIFCRATNSHTGPVNSKNRSPSSSSKKKKKKKSPVIGADDFEPLNSNDFELLRDFSVDAEVQNAVTGFDSDSSLYFPDDMPLPEPPTGFVLDDDGKVLFTSTNRLTTVVDPTNNLPLECVIRRVFKSSDRDECMLLCPVDTPVQILKSTFDGWAAISDEEVESILPAAAFALAKIQMHLVYSGYCYTARGGFCYTEEDILDFHSDDGEEVDGLPNEGVEITYFDLMIVCVSDKATHKGFDWWRKPVNEEVERSVTI